MPPPPITQESGSHPGLVDGDAVGQIEVLELFAQLVGGDRPPAGMDDRRVGRVSRMHQVGAAIVIALLGVERTDDVHVMLLLGHAGHVLADLHSRRRGVDRPEGAAALLALGLEVPDVEMARPARHPEDNATAVVLANLVGIGIQWREELQRRDAQRRCGEVSQKMAAVQLGARS